jgi:hypothetical protein
MVAVYSYQELPSGIPIAAQPVVAHLSEFDLSLFGIENPHATGCEQAYKVRVAAERLRRQQNPVSRNKKAQT